eukprot:TRINITY_DN20495_c0_g1_i1.p1 TRINITY_DN20495_c0_g1~~TRINITY_DN20495_c0_g1_i1.p1  ORF type:complete len:388 (+),score=68.09 TRINITY_DN20495_c0_g1_i1:62-1225(+)
MGNCECTQAPVHHKTIDPDMKYLRKRRWSSDLDRPKNLIAVIESESEVDPEDVPNHIDTESEASSSIGQTLSVVVVLPIGNQVFDVGPRLSVKRLKMQIARSHKLSFASFDLIFAGDKLSESKKVLDHPVVDGCVIELVMSREAERAHFSENAPCQKAFIKSIMEDDDDQAMEYIMLGANLASKEFYSGYTPLCAAAFRGNTAFVLELLRWSEVTPDKVCDWGSPLFLACSRGHLETVKVLVSTGRVNINEPFRLSGTPLYIACRNGAADVVEYLASRPNILINKMGATCTYNHTPLFAATASGHVDVVRILLAHPRIKAKKYSGHAYDMYEPLLTPFDVATDTVIKNMLRQHLGIPSEEEEEESNTVDKGEVKRENIEIPRKLYLE